MFFINKIIALLNDKEYKMLPSFLAFYLLESLFPALSFILFLIRVLNINEEIIINIINKILPIFSVDFSLSYFINNINPSFSIVINLLSFNIIARAIRKLSDSLNSIYKYQKNSFVKKYIRSYIFTFLFLLFVVIEIIALLIIMYFFDNSLIGFLTFPLTFLSYFFLLFLMYRYLPSYKMKWKNIYPGAIFTSLGIGILFVIFPILQNKFIRLDSIYGSIGWIMILLFVLHIISYLIYLGIILNSLYLKKEVLIYEHNIRGKI